MSGDDERDAAERPTGDQMLARLRADDPRAGGRLRIYLGMAPGVGKTYRMLEEAHRRQDRGTDVAVGFVETYGRRLTAALLDGLDIVRRARIEHRGVVVEEMDTAAVIARHPRVVLVDELAHTNAPGSPREKRWQDVAAIREAGIDVISTCNVQHIESVADAVETILGVPVRERVPDAVVREADEIELVDMTPQALRQRMRHGNVYPPDRAAVALERFFTETNLTALRDLSLRFVAGEVDAQLEDAIAARGDDLGPVTERVMVVIDESPASRRALRRGAFLASALRTHLVAVAIVSPGVELSRDRQLDMQANVDYAVDLGAEVIRGEARDFVKGVAEVARDQRVTHLVLVHHRRHGFDRMLRPSVAARILEELPRLEVHLVSDEPVGHH
jgi:two-component system, OmpR family, sensor histidine kinase KdpD